MRKLFSICALVGMCGCQQEVSVPTVRELIDNRQLLAVWEAKCNTGEYSHLAEEQKARFCSTTQNASISVAVISSGKKESDFFKANTLRK